MLGSFARGDEGPGEVSGLQRDLIVVTAVVGTATFVVAASVAAIWPDVLATPVAVFDVALFAVGSIAFVWSFLQVVGRSRYEVVSVPGTWLLTGGVAPAPVRRILLGALAAQAVVALVTASVRPFTPVAFGILVPTFGLGLCGLWAARHGSFPARDR
ncbi:MAG TPA: hypothetical protein VMN58_05875 [Acidimicrobiales bacterium]|nr:hypothetical protein [Acidimicrobiales bacterium]